MVICDKNNKSIQIKRFLSKSTRVPHAKFYICKKVFFFENFDYRATLNKLIIFVGVVIRAVTRMLIGGGDEYSYIHVLPDS